MKNFYHYLHSHLLYRWSSLFSIFEKIGSLLCWNISPFFSKLSQFDPSSSNGIDALYQAVGEIYHKRKRYQPTELAYLSIVVFLRSIVSYYELRENSSCDNQGMVNVIDILYLSTSLST